MRGRRVGHGQYERLLSGRLELPAQLSQPEQHGRLLLRPGGAGRVHHGRQVRVHQLRVARRQSENPCNRRENGIRYLRWFRKHRGCGTSTAGAGGGGVDRLKTNGDEFGDFGTFSISEVPRRFRFWVFYFFLPN